MTPESADDYIAGCSADAQVVLERIRSIGRSAIPGGEERISYRIPAFARGGRIVFYYAAFTHHIGIFPPVKGDAALMKALAPYRGGKGSLKFQLDERMPYGLIRHVVRALLKAQVARQAQRRSPTGRSRVP
jgi:uncharacterized protein YdhG (YjbR/CyaY superfamily)